MDGVRLSSVCAAVEWRWCALLPVCPMCAARALPIPVQYSSVLLSCRVLFHCQVVCCGVGDYLCEVFVWWGILCLLPPRSGGGGGYRGWWGGMVRRGWHCVEGRVCCSGGWQRCGRVVSSLTIPCSVVIAPSCSARGPCCLWGGVRLRMVCA